MSRSRVRVRVAALLVAAAVFLGAGQRLSAQSMSGPTTGTYKGPGVKGKMGSTTNKERWSAAIRRADAKATQIRKTFKKKGS